ncbi:NUDIX domain-containing protein [Psychrobacter sp. I-STPA10]|uniref:NUDIX domain-containing protein n=1 Tax=Psychrobacter sp. I-STPA10 TaxID=2585769 RepID=UPI001E31483F|nr:NUDIX domain-containing protein [Psychrobacter sp. I-STPA10]
MSALERIKKLKPLKQAMLQLKNADNAVARIRASKQVALELQKLGVYAVQDKQEVSQTTSVEPKEAVLPASFKVIHSWDSKKADKDFQVILKSKQGNLKTASATYFAEKLQGYAVKTTLGYVLLNSKAKGKMTSRANREAIALAIPRIPEILLQGSVGDREELNKDRSDSFIAFYEFSKKIQIDSKTYLARIKIGERIDGGNSAYYIASQQLDSLQNKENSSCLSRKLNKFDLKNRPSMRYCDELLFITPQLNNEVNQFDKLTDKTTNATIFEVLLDSLEVELIDDNHAEDSLNYGDVLVINQDNHILLVQRNADDDFMPNKWWIPGGKIEEGESSAEGASRELFEETGIKISPSKLKAIDSKRLENGNTSHRFVANVGDDVTVKLQKGELQGFAWVSIDEIGKYDLLSDLSDLQSLLKGINQPLDKDDDKEPDNITSTSIGASPYNRNSIDTPTTQATRQKSNNRAIELLEQIKTKGLTRSDLTDEQIETLAKYTGNGGGLTGRDGKRGSAYEYYTPKELASGMWELAKQMGFTGGQVLDPSAGTGIFTATSPQTAIIDSVELDETSGGIAKILNDGKRSHTVVAPFEQEASRIDDNSQDMVITNVPFGSKTARGANRLLDNAYQNESLENYFILRSLEKIKPGGLAIFITPTAVVSGKKSSHQKLRKLTSLKAEFMGAYRLPNSVFSQTGADVITDVVVYRKHSSDALDAIDELYKSGELDTLTTSNVLWDEYLSGKYFEKTGKHFILGEVKQVTDRFGKLADKVVSTKPTSEIAKMMTKFGDSRIDWQLLNASEPTFIQYHNGDTVFQNGKQLTYRDGVWHETENVVTDTDREMQSLLANLSDATGVVINEVTWQQIEELLAYCQSTNQRDLIDSRMMALIDNTKKSATRNNLQATWQCIALAKAIEDTIAKHGYGYDYVNHAPDLTEAMKTAYLDGKNSKLTGQAKQAWKLIGLHYQKGKYSSTWRGDVDTTIDTGDSANSYENKMARMQYENKSLYLSREQLAELYPEIDPLRDDNWFINHDGSQVIHADDFLVGNLAERLRDIDSQISKATDEDIKAKLIAQKAVARQQVHRIDFRKMQFDLRSPLIDAETKVKFLKQFVHKDAYVSYDEYGRGTPDIDVSGSNLYDSEKLYNRIGDWLAKGTITLGGIKLGMSDREALDWLSEDINKANVQFNAWVKANDKLMLELDQKANSDDNLYFTQNSDESPIDIAGLNPELSLHGYQNAFVRSQGRYFGGINGMGVGLGKTFSALASTQHVHNIGAKQKTLFVVPNSVLSNWRKEAQFAFENMDDCIFVGLRQKGDGFRVYSNKYDEDLLEAINGKYRKVFVTYEAFRRIRLKEGSIEEYAKYLKFTDTAYEHHELKKEDEKAQGLVAELIQTIDIKSNAPYLEDMGIDSVVVDEAHAFKNSISAPNTESQVKYLSLSQTSTRGEDAQAKLWYIRSLSANNDGVQLLSATPITNSPLEIYSMLSLAGGRRAVNSMAGGINGADDFIQVMCQIEEEVVPTIDGGERSQNVFIGIRNVQILRHAINSTATIKDASDVGLSVVIPERDEVASKVKLDDDTVEKIKLFQQAYKMAQAIVNDKLEARLPPEDPNSPFNPNSPYLQVKRMFGEPDELMAHPFNLIRKMDVMIADDEFSNQATFYDFDKEQKNIAEKVINTFNKKKYSDERSRISPFTNPDNASEKWQSSDGVKTLIGYKVIIKASIIMDQGRERIVIDTLNAKVQSSFEAMADKAGLKLDVTVPAKLAMMLENFKNEMANPRGVHNDGTNSKIVKQIIFCDHLFLHNKIKRLLTTQAGMSANKIVIITGQTNNEPDQMIDIQDGFNAMGEDNLYQVVIANKKAEVGINLQKGTQAIHHLTTGWTPDSLEQRNGRGARQGNKTDKVTIYHYDADGTFDEFKRTMINKKDEWISSVLSNDDKNTVAVSGGISREEQDALISSIGDQDAIDKYQAQRAKNEQKARVETAKRRQMINLDIITEQRQLLDKLSIKSFYERDFTDVISIVRDNVKNLQNSQKNSRKEVTRQNDIKKYQSAKAIAIAKLQTIIDSVELQERSYSYGKPDEPEKEKVAVTITADDLYDKLEQNYKEFKPSDKGRFWKNGFEKLLSGSYSMGVIIKEDSDYQAEYDETRQTAENLIKQSGIAIDDIAKEVGGLPVGAGVKIVKGEAKVVRDTYVEKEAFVVDDETETLAVITDDLNIYQISIDGYHKGKAERAHINLANAQVILPDDKDYLEYIKQAAQIEDNLHAQGDLQEPLYSNTVPMVTEYRDKDIQPIYDIKIALVGHHHKLINGKFPFVLPVWMLNSSTLLSDKLIESYEKDGVVVDLTNKTFTLEHDSHVTVVRDGFYALESMVSSMLADFIKANNIKLDINDESVIAINSLLVVLLNDKPTNIDDIIADMVSKLNESDNPTLNELIKQFYQEYFYESTYLPDDLDEHKIDRLLAIKLRLGAKYEYLSDYLHDLSMQQSSTSSNDAMQADDLVNITGNTRAWKDDIKDYASNYGAKIKGNRKYLWNGRDKCWVISYGAYLKLIEDKPQASNDLQIEKVS